MKLKMARKDLYGENVFRTDYCSLCHLLGETEDAIGYNAGVYGWNWDCYLLYTSDSKRVYITTGYRNMIGDNIPYALVEKYESEASRIRAAWDWKTEPFSV